MSGKAEEHGAGSQVGQHLDALKWLVVALVIIGGIYAYYHYDGIYPVVYRALALLPVTVVAIYVAALTVQGGAFFALLRESVTETRRVVWPTRQETVQTTLVVVGFVFVMALVLWGLDAAFGKLVSVVIG